MINYMLTQISAYSIMNEFHCSLTAKEDKEHAHACEREGESVFRLYKHY